MSTQKRLSAKEYREQKRRGVEWVSPTGLVVRTRRLSLMDHATINKFPSHLREMMYRSIETSSKLRRLEDVDDVFDPFAGLSGEDTLRSARELAVRMIELAWIDPKIVETYSDDDEIAEHELIIDDVEDDDLTAFLGWVMGNYQEQASALDTFPERSTVGVGTGSGVSEIRGMAEPAAATRSERDIRPDSV